MTKEKLIKLLLEWKQQEYLKLDPPWPKIQKEIARLYQLK